MSTQTPTPSCADRHWILLLLTAAYYGIRALNGGENGKLKASGTIEAVMVDISPELAGTVRQVLVEEGDQVAANGQPLLVLDDSLILQQTRLLPAGLDSAQAASAARAECAGHCHGPVSAGTRGRPLDGTQIAARVIGSRRTRCSLTSRSGTSREPSRSGRCRPRSTRPRQDWQAAEANCDDVLQSLDKTEFLAAEQTSPGGAGSRTWSARTSTNGRRTPRTRSAAGSLQQTHCGTQRGLPPRRPQSHQRRVPLHGR